MVTADLVPVSVNDRLPWFEAHSPATRPIWVACANSSDEIAAWLSFDTFYPRAAYDGTAMLALYVAEGHRRNGLGNRCSAERSQPRPASGCTRCSATSSGKCAEPSLV
jgi:phosphinothricin acetyltransferase